MTAPTPIRVVGLTFRKESYPANLHRLADLLEEHAVADIRDGTTSPGVKVLLERDAGNEHDANAIEVHVPALGRRGWVGFIDRDLAVRWAQRMDRDETYEAWVHAVPIDPRHLDKPGLDIVVVWGREAEAVRQTWE